MRKIKVVEIDIVDTLGPIGPLAGESGTSCTAFDDQDDHIEPKSRIDGFLQNLCQVREFPLTD